jgi:hypothetical protein
MEHLSKETQLAPDEIIARAARFFGPEGLGLTICEQSDHGVSFEGGGGYVTVQALPRESGATVDVATSEWERQGKTFLTTV